MMDTRQALQMLPGPDPRGERRIRLRLARTRAERRHRLARRLSLVLLAAVVTLLAVAFVRWPDPARTLSIATSPATPEPIAWTDGVELVAAGRGEVRGTARAVHVRWQSGGLEARVEPGVDVALHLEADEGEVRVSGTPLRVVRDALGLSVEPLRGALRVACADGMSHEVVAGRSVTCWPGSPARLLGRADALEDRGASLDEVRATLDRALASTAGDDPVRGELLARRMRVLAAVDEPRAALDDADAYVATFAVRARDVHAFAVDVAIEGLGDCARALPHLPPLLDDPDHRWLLDRCEGGLPALVDGSADASGEEAARSERVRRWSRHLRAAR